MTEASAPAGGGMGGLALAHLLGTNRSQASGMRLSSAARPRSAQIITGRRRRRSTQTPANGPSTRMAMFAQNATTPSSNAEPVSR